MLDTKTKRLIQSAGCWFIGEYASLLNDEYRLITTDTNYKNKLIYKIFNESRKDSDISGTRIRVNAVLNIISDNKIVEALEYVVTSDRINSDNPKAVTLAKEALSKIRVK